MPQYHGLTRSWDGSYFRVDWTGEVRWFDGVLTRELARLSRPRCKPRRIAMCLMSDIAHPAAKIEWLLACLQFCEALPQHKFIFITKRPDILAERIILLKFRPLPNVMLMATCEDQQRADERGPHMLKLAAQRWHTGAIAEPMLGKMGLGRMSYCPTHDFESGFCHGPCPDRVFLSWVVCGMEQGPGKRYAPTWQAGKLADECAAAGVPFFFKKDSEGEPSILPRQFPAWMLVEGEASA